MSNGAEPLAKSFKAGPVEITVGGDAGSLVAIAGHKPFPKWQVGIGQISAKATTGEPIKLGSSAGQVQFSGTASAYAGIGLYSEGSKLVSDLGIATELGGGLLLPNETGWGYCLLRWGYDLSGSVAGSVALAAPAKVTFGVDGSHEAVFGVVRRFRTDTDAFLVVQGTVENWKMPAAVRGPNDLALDTWLITEVDGKIETKLAASYGYDFNWVRQLKIGGLAGDVGLKLNAAISVALGFDANGKFALVVSREAADPGSVRLRLFKVAKKGWSFSFDGGVNATTSETVTPDKFTDFVQAVFGVHGLQVVKDLKVFEDWTDPNKPLSGELAKLSIDEVKSLVQEVTGKSPDASFDAARKQLLAVLQRWDDLPQKVAASIWAHIPDQAALKNVANIAAAISTTNQDTVRKLIEAQLSHVDFFNTAEGKWLESAAEGAVLSALTGIHEFRELQDVAAKTAAILDGSALQDTLMRLQGAITKRLNLDQIEDAIRANDASKVNAWLVAKLTALLGPVDNIPALAKARELIHSILQQAPSFYDKAVKALNHSYGFSIAAKYQSADASSALLDVSFDLNQQDAALRFGDALRGSFDELLLRQATGVTLHAGVLTHNTQRQWHVEVSLPFYSSTTDEIISSLATARAVDEADGRVLVYELKAEDAITARNRRDSRLAVAAFYASGAVRTYGRPSVSCNYSYVFQQPKMRRPAVVWQLKPYVDAYFPMLFHGNVDAGSFSEWIGDLDKYIDQKSFNGTDNFGDTRVRLEINLPPETASFWLRLRPEDTRRRYPAMSRSIQATVRNLIYSYHFADPRRYTDLAASTALLVCKAIPVSTNIAFDSPLRFNQDTQDYWDYLEPDLRQAVVRDSHTTANLARVLEQIQDVLRGQPELSGVRGYYEPQSAGALQTMASGLNGFADQRLVSLLRCESMLITGAKQAAEDMLAFLDPKSRQSPSRAVEVLTRFGEHATSTFNDLDVYTGDAIRPLCPLLMAAVAQALCPDLNVTAPTAMLSLYVMQNGKPLPPLDTVPNPGDVVVQQRLVSL